MQQLTVGGARALLLHAPQSGRNYVGLSGGIGSGKSTLALAFSKAGATVFSADQLAREAVEPGTAGLAAIVAHFGQGMLSKDGTLDRGALGALVFEDPGARTRLEEITHPLIAQRAAQLAAQAQTSVVVYDVPLLVEAQLQDDFNTVVIVDAPLEKRLDRLEARGLAREDALARIAAQAKDAQRRQVADIWVDNEGTSADLSALGKQIYDRWLLRD